MLIKVKMHIFAFLVWGRKWQGKIYSFLWRIPPVRVLLRSYVLIPENKQLKNIHRNKRAFIIGNGHSILKHDLTKLNGEIVFVLNNFLLHPQYHKINPSYLCVCDVDVADVKYRMAWYKLHQKVNTVKTTMLFDKKVEKMDKKYGFFRNHKVYYLNTASKFLPPLSSLKTCPIDITMPLSGHFLVLTDMALITAAYMGINEIYLLGFDSQPINSFKDYLNYDFYGKDPLTPVSQYKKWYEFHHQNKALKNSRVGLWEKTAKCINQTFKKKGINIYNATYHRGNLTGFKYVDYEDVVNRG